MWLRLSYLQLPAAIQATKVNGQWHSAAISGRYKAMLRKQFHLNGLPWIFEGVPVDRNPRNKAPKGHKRVALRAERVNSIKRAVSVSYEASTAHLQEQLNKRCTIYLYKKPRWIQQGFTPFFKPREKGSADEKMRKGVMKTLNREDPKQEEEEFDF